MSHQCNMTPRAVHVILERPQRIGFAGQRAIQHAPYNEGSRLHGLQVIDARYRAQVSLFEFQQCPIPPARNLVKVPLGPAGDPFSLRHDGQLPSLGEACSLETQSEPSQIVGTSGVKRTPAPVPHRLHQFVPDHAPPVVEDRDIRSAGRREEEFDSRGCGGQRVVDEICDGCLERVPDGPHRFQQSRGDGRR